MVTHAKSEIRQAFRTYFPEHPSGIRDWQEAAIAKALNGESVLVIAATGSGKSVCYQIPALMLADAGRGMTIVISPLIALMTDQVGALGQRRRGVAALNSTMDSTQQMDLLRRLAAGELSVLFVAPERTRDELFLAALELCPTPVGLCVIDEAHCISEWGHDFRTDYLSIPDFLRRVDEPPVVAMTATATKRVEQEVCSELSIGEAIRVAPMHRDNLALSVVRVDKASKEQTVLGLVRQLPKPGLVYTSSRLATQELSDLMMSHGIRSDYYHAERTPSEKKRVQKSFMSDDLDVLCATNAFGMGIDKPNIRFVVHYQIPGSIEAYHQEVGRGGRDGDLCHCVLLYDPSDTVTHKRFISQAYRGRETIATTYHDVLGLGPSLRSTRRIREIPASFLTGETPEHLVGRILLKMFERDGLVERRDEMLETIPVVAASPAAIDSCQLRGFVDRLGSGQVRVSDLARATGSVDSEALRVLYRAALKGELNIGSRADRFIRYERMRDDLSPSDIDRIDAWLTERRNYRVDRLQELVSYAEERSACRASQIGRYLGDMERRDQCGRCDNCTGRSD